MARERIIVRSSGGDVRIVIRDRKRIPPSGTGEPSEHPRSAPAGRARRSDRLTVPLRLVQLMEIRVEGSFRPKHPDVEVTYAMSGQDVDRVDRLHQLASHQIVFEATPVSVTSALQAVVNEVIEETDGSPALVLQVHTHPSSIPLPSDGDREFFAALEQVVATMLPGARTLFAVHAVSREQSRRREPPLAASDNEIRWSSIYREHRVGFFHPNATPCGVELG